MGIKPSNSFSHIQLQTAIIFWVLVIALVVFICCAFFAINTITAVEMGIACFVLSVTSLILKRNTIAYALLSCCIGFLLFANAENDTIHFSEKIIPIQRGVVRGEVTHIQRQDSLQTRLILNGWIDTKYLPKQENLGIRLNIFSDKGRKEIKVGDTLFAFCNVRPPQARVFDDAFYERGYARGIGVNWFASTNSDRMRIVSRATGHKRLRNAINTAITSHIDTLFSPPTAGLVKAIMLADRSELTYEVKQYFSISGVAHLLSLSGLHIGILSGILLLLLNSFTRNRWIKFICFALLVTCFVYLTGMQDSAIRAGAMSMLMLLGWVLQRHTEPINIVSIVLLVAMIVSPSMLHSGGFQMSVFSVVGIFIFYPLIRNRLVEWFNVEREHTIRQYIINSLSITLSVSVLMNPITAYYFDSISIISPLTNMLVIPLFSLGLLLSIISVGFSFIYIPLGSIYATSVEVCIRVCQWIAMKAASLDFAAITNTDYLTFYALLVSIAMVYCLLSKQWQAFLLRLCLSVWMIFIVSIIIPNPKEANVEVYPTNNYCLLSVSLTNGGRFLWLADKHPNQTYYRDIGLSNYLANKEIKCVAVSGRFGYESCKNKNIKNIRLLTLAEQRGLERLFLRGKNIKSIIEHYSFIPNEKYNR